MTDKDIAEITARVLVSAIESGRIASAKAEDVAEYYAVIHNQVVASADEYAKARTEMLNGNSM